MDKKVIEIPARELDIAETNKPLRVAAYCRVSTDKDEQQNSLEMQVKYYTEKTQGTPNWKLAGIFTDEGISGTTDKKRPEFMRMVRMCQGGRIDRILTKSISRFSRNTVDCLSWIRKLKALGVSVLFEKEGIDTAESMGETFLTWFSAFAQAESESISQNVTWGVRKGFKEGRYNFHYHHFCGYEKGPDGQPSIVEDEAVIIRRIFASYLEGVSLRGIKEWLEKEEVPSPSGMQQWNSNTIWSILNNEKYCGDVLCQKTYTADFLTSDVRKNKGELPQYFIEDNHPAIVTKEVFRQVHEEMQRRASVFKPKEKKSRYSSKYALTGKVTCAECGALYRRTTWTNRAKERKIVWRCINRLENGTKNCKESPSVPEEELKNAVLKQLKTKLSGLDVVAVVTECLEQLGIDIPQELEKLSLTQDDRLTDCFDILVRQTVQKVMVSKTDICIIFV